MGDTKAFMDVIGYIIIFAILAIIVGAIVLTCFLNKKIFLQRTLCKNCNYKYTAKDISYKILSGEKRITTTKNSLYKKVGFFCKCPQCNNIVMFTNSFEVQVLYKSGAKGKRVHRKYTYNLEELIANYYIRMGYTSMENTHEEK